ncbi:MFS transporter [Sphingobacterium corticis]|uniref:MFS transporter n=1 Tax=Sphingobacterium corticis TaxID=1812823 RepID=A0ABW5NIE6_9SPHI
MPTSTCDVTSDAPLSERRRIRIAVAAFYFCQGLAFASWASRIPTIKQALELSEGELGTILLMLPIGQLLTMPISGNLVSKFGSHRLLPIVGMLYVANLFSIALAPNAWWLGAALLLFGIIGNMCNIAVNTQGVLAEGIYQRSIMSSFHGTWSIAGFTGALIGLICMTFNIGIEVHFLIVTAIVWTLNLANRKYLAPPAENAPKKSGFAFKPDGMLISLGIVGFCSMATEGAMFDWSGVYFDEVVHAPKSLIVLGYASFMIMMATARFIGDKVLTRFGRRRMLQYSGILMFLGLAIAVSFPTLMASTAGFMLVGFGVACNVPTIYSVAGKHPTIPSGMALAMVSSLSYLGFLIGPPLIGYLAELSSLRISYGVFSLFGLLLFAMCSMLSVFKKA